MADGVDHTPFEPPAQPKHPPLSVTVTPCPDHTAADTDLLSPHAPLPPPTHSPRRGPHGRQQHGGLQNLDNYFVGPRDLSHHSKWPTFCRMHGSILPKMLLPLLFVGAWATAVTVISETLHPLGVNSVLLTITGFVVGLGLSFRSSSAYERYQEGRKYWTSLITASQTLGRVFWIHAADRADPDPDSLTDPRAAILARLGAMNLLLAFALSLKHALRFEPFTDYDDMRHLVAHLDTFARAATENPDDSDDGNDGDNNHGSTVRPKPGLFKSVGEYLGVSFATSNPRKPLKRAARPLGNLPLEILSHLASTVDQLVAHQQLPVPMQQTLAYSNLTVLGDVLAGCERVLNTPLPLAYSIAISQTTWVYVMLLPFQLVGLLGYVAIPATLAAAYIILGLLLIGRQIEDPFGHDVNDLPMDSFCDQIAAELDIIASFEKRPVDVMFAGKDSFPLFPVSSAPASVWMQRSEQKLRHAVRTKPNATFERRRERHATKVRRLPKRKADENV